MYPKIALGLFAVFMFFPVAVQAEDAALCSAIDKVIASARSEFSELKSDDETAEGEWDANLYLPVANDCSVLYDPDDESSTYSCYFRMKQADDIKLHLSSFIEKVAAYRPDMKRSGQDNAVALKSSHVQITFQYWAESFRNEFAVSISRADKYQHSQQGQQSQYWAVKPQSKSQKQAL